MKKIKPEALAAIIASRDFDALLALIQPYIAGSKGRPPTVGQKGMSRDEFLQHKRDLRRDARAKARAQNLTPDDHADEELTELAGQQWEMMQELQRQDVE